MPTPRKKTSGTQKAVKIDDELFYSLDEWLKTGEAKKLGYHSKAQFANEAISKLLLDRRKLQFTNITILENEGRILLVDNGINIKMDPRVEIWMKTPDNFVCQLCDDTDCIHIKAVEESSTYKEFIKKRDEDLAKEYEEDRAREAADIAGF